MDKLKKILNKKYLLTDDFARDLIELFITSNQEPSEQTISQFSKKIWFDNLALKKYFGTWEDVKARLMDHFRLLYEQK